MGTGGVVAPNTALRHADKEETEARTEVLTMNE
jgi:hypothetical protein